jgi:predicted AAA+ superfamily ATPase
MIICFVTPGENGVKAIHSEVVQRNFPLKLIELQREDLPSITILLEHLRASPFNFILFCDDLSFSNDDQHYKALKAVLDGGVSYAGNWVTEFERVAYRGGC